MLADCRCLQHKGPELRTDNTDSEARLGPASALNLRPCKSGGEIIITLLVVKLHLDCFTEVVRASLAAGPFHSRGSSFKESSPTKLETHC